MSARLHSAPMVEQHALSLSHGPISPRFQQTTTIEKQKQNNGTVLLERTGNMLWLVMVNGHGEWQWHGPAF